MRISYKKNTKNFIWKIAKNESSFAIGSIPIIWQILFFYLPLITLFGSSFVKFSNSGQITKVTAEHFIKIFDSSYQLIILNSFILATSTTLVCILIGFPVSYYIVFHYEKIKNLLLFLLLIPFWTNCILHIYAWFFVLEKNGFLNNLLINIGIIKQPLHILNSYFSILLMMVYFYLPFVILPIYSAMERINPLLIQASYDLGANKRQTVRKVIVPLTINAIRAGIFLVYIPAFGEFVIPELMGGNRDFFAGNVISLLIFNNDTQSIGIAFTVLSSILLLISIYLIDVSLKILSKKLCGSNYR